MGKTVLKKKGFPAADLTQPTTQRRKIVVGLCSRCDEHGQTVRRRFQQEHQAKADVTPQEMQVPHLASKNFNASNAFNIVFTWHSHHHRAPSSRRLACLE